MLSPQALKSALKDIDISKKTLCHICGDIYPKSFIPKHQQQCIKKSVKRRPKLNHSEPIKAKDDSIYYPCTSCMRNIPKDMLTVHLKTCRGESKHQSLTSSYKGEESFIPKTATKSSRTSSIPAPVVKDNQNNPRMGKNNNPLPFYQERKSEITLPFLETSEGPLKPRLQEELQDHVLNKSSSSHLHRKEEPLKNINGKVDTELKSKNIQQPEMVESKKLNESEESELQGERIPCEFCGRKFFEDALDRHKPVCEKVQLKRRKVFDASKARIKGTELEKYQEQDRKNSTKDADLQKAKKKTDSWRQRHEHFLNMIRTARNPSQNNPSVSDPLYDEYVTCEYCQRKFNETAAERHIPHCKQRAQKNHIKKAPDVDKLNKRIAYKPPAPKVGKTGNEKKPVKVSSAGSSQQHIFCHSCGCKYQSAMAKFCFECGSRKPSH